MHHSRIQRYGHGGAPTLGPTEYAALVQTADAIMVKHVAEYFARGYEAAIEGRPARFLGCSERFRVAYLSGYAAGQRDAAYRRIR